MKPNTSVRLHLLLIAVFVTRYYVVAGYQNGVLVLIQEQINKTDIETKFYEFQQLFGVDIGKSWIDFQMGYGKFILYILLNEKILPQNLLNCLFVQ